MISAFVFVCALGIDYLVGEMRRFHPLVGFGNFAAWVEKKVNQTHNSAFVSFIWGMFAWLFVICVPLCVCLMAYHYLPQYLPQYFPQATFIFDGVLLYFAIGYKSLCDHVKRIYTALVKNDLAQAKMFTSHIVSRDTEHMTKGDARKAALESLLENGSDAVFAPIFWFVCLGGPGVLLYRLANTLDAMWGYKNARFLYFGKFAAHIDDVLNWLPARMVAVSYMFMGNFNQGWRCWQCQAKHCASPNAGPVMAAGAGALNVRLGGDTSYHGVIETRPVLGDGHLAEDVDILRGLRMVRNTLVLWVFLVALFYVYTDYSGINLAQLLL